MKIVSSPTDLSEIAAKVECGDRLNYDDGVRLFASPDIHEIGRLANIVRDRLHGNAAYYNINRHINYTNFCVLRCKFCSFYRPYSAKAGPADQAKAGNGRSISLLSDQPDEYELSVDQVAANAKAAADGGATEVHIVGGLHPKLPFDYYLDMCRAIKTVAPRLHIKAFTAIEIIHFTRITKPRLSIREVLEQLRDAGLGSLPGGGAEIFDDRVHDEAYKNKVGEAGWFDVHDTAHEIGVPSNATMLYGHIERPEERITHMIKLREHQDVSLREHKAAFNCFIPLSFIPDDSELAHLPGPTGLDDLKTLAISRLMLDNIAHIKAFWIMQSAKLSQIALDWGVDDIDGTVVQYDITKREGGAGNRHQEMTIDQLHRLIRETGREPIERDTLYRRVERQGGDWKIVADDCENVSPKNRIQSV
ncbi:MAG: CofH family radical SAM protein [Phycisphaerales bacterium]|nr:CofH family radical SAM protein [Phycisphaerales bacterium]MCB9855676.1 CofH family radical SAM protein [Phycisphaerales bacterium]MCB9862571.1 CofH family radical SAM protein [Phycisphaerales bacterium]